MNLSGIFPPLPTAFDHNDELLTNKMQENITHLSQYDLAGFLILGSNGELVMLSETEKAEVYQACRRAIPPEKLMITGTGGQSTQETLRLCRLAADADANAALVLNPSYYKGLMTTEALKKHYFELAEESHIPIIIYNMPANSGMDLSADQILTLSTHPNIIGLKDSGGNLAKMGQIIDQCDADFQVLAGSAGFLLPALSIGAVGGILALANIMPQKCIDLFSQFNRKNLSDAAHIQRSIIELNTLVTRGWGVPALKAAMDELGLYGGPCRKPIQALGEEQIQVLLDRLKQARTG